MAEIVGLDLDPKFRGFFYCSIWDPALEPGSGPDESALYKMVYLARRDRDETCVEFANTMEWTLRVEAFECFQRLHGPRPVRFEHWFYAKLEQLLSVLLYEELLVYGIGESLDPVPPQTDRPWEEGDRILTGRSPLIQRDDLERAFSPRDGAQYGWGILVGEILQAGERRLVAFQQFIKKRIEERGRLADSDGAATKQPRTSAAPPSGRRRRSETAERGLLIRSCLKRGVERFEICRRLDARGFPTTPKMQKCGHQQWTSAWTDLETGTTCSRFSRRFDLAAKAVKSCEFPLSFFFASSERVTIKRFGCGGDCPLFGARCPVRSLEGEIALPISP